MYLCCYLAHEFSFWGEEGTYFKLQSFFFLFRLSSVFQTCKYNFQKLKKSILGRYFHTVVPQQLGLRPTQPMLCFPSISVLPFCGIKGSPVLLASCWFFTCPDSPFWPGHLTAPGFHLGGQSRAQASHSL